MLTRLAAEKGESTKEKVSSHQMHRWVSQGIKDDPWNQLHCHSSDGAGYFQLEIVEIDNEESWSVQAASNSMTSGDRK